MTPKVNKSFSFDFDDTDLNGHKNAFKRLEDSLNNLVDCRNRLETFLENDDIATPE